MNNAKTIAGFAVVAAAATLASAGPVTFDYDGTAQGRNVTVDVPGFHSGQVFAGGIRHLVDGELAITYCIDPDQWAQSGTKTFQQTGLTQALGHRGNAGVKAAAIAELADSIGDSLWTTGVSRDTAAAFQVAVWEIIMDLDTDAESSTLDFSSGTFQASGRSQVFAAANNMLAGLTFGRGNDSGYVAWTHESHQDFMGQVVPTPAGFALAGVALPLLTGRRQRKA